MHPSDHRTARQWSVVAPFFNGAVSDRWIDDFIEDSPWAFRKVPFGAAGDDWHSRSNRATGFGRWFDYWDQSKRALPAAGVITNFPQAALVMGVQKSLQRLDIPLLAWCFNLGHHPQGVRRLAARKALRSVDRFVVHSSGEIATVSTFLDISPDTVRFVPLQRAPIPIEAAEDAASPFVAAMGSANRDYATFFRAAEISSLPCKVIAAPRSLEGLRIPPNVAIQSGLSATQCHHIVQRSRFSVIPLDDAAIASGQVTVVESLRMKKPVIATHSLGTIDYIRHGHSGVLVPPHDPDALATAMLQLWEDEGLRQQYARNAAEFAETSLSDPAAARSLAAIISELERER